MNRLITIFEYNYNKFNILMKNSLIILLFFSIKAYAFDCICNTKSININVVCDSVKITFNYKPYRISIWKGEKLVENRTTIWNPKSDFKKYWKNYDIGFFSLLNDTVFILYNQGSATVYAWNIITDSIKIVAGGKGFGKLNTQFSFIDGLSINRKDSTLFIGDANNFRVMSWKIGDTIGKVVAGITANSRQDKYDLKKLSFIDDVCFVDDTLFIAESKRIVKRRLSDTLFQIIGKLDNYPKFITSKINIFKNDVFLGSQIVAPYIGASYLLQYNEKDSVGSIALGVKDANIPGIQFKICTTFSIDGLGNFYIREQDRVYKYSLKDTVGQFILGYKSTNTLNSFDSVITNYGGLALDCNGNIYTGDATEYGIKRFKNEISNTFFISDTGTYKMKLYFFDGDSLIKEFIRSPSLELTLGKDKTLCDSSFLIIPEITNSIGNIEYFWQDGSIKNIYIAKSTGNYNCIINDSLCKVKDSVFVNFKEHPHFMLLQDILMDCEKKPILIKLDIDSIPILWNDGSINKIREIKDTGNYNYVINHECSIFKDTFNVQLTEDCDCELVLPNIFTPNGDGKNDYWFVKNNCASVYNIEGIYVYNRYGELVFQTKTMDTWDGTYNGQSQPAGTYIGTVKVMRSKTNKLITKTVNINLIR